MAEPVTLEDALLDERFETKSLKGFRDQIEILTKEAKTLTLDEITEILNSESHNLSTESIESLRKLARIRIKNGQPLLPWKNYAGLGIEKAGHKKAVEGW